MLQSSSKIPKGKDFHPSPVASSSCEGGKLRFPLSFPQIIYKCARLLLLCWQAGDSEAQISGNLLDGGTLAPVGCDWVLAPLRDIFWGGLGLAAGAEERGRSLEHPHCQLSENPSGSSWERAGIHRSRNSVSPGQAWQEKVTQTLSSSLREC